MSELSETLKAEAVSRGLCKKWTEEWSEDCDKQSLIDRYVRGIDFILRQGEWPENGFIKRNFEEELLHKNLIFVDETVVMENAPSGVYILNGSCTGMLVFSGWAAATVYLRHDCHVRIFADDYSKVFVRLYDDAEADVWHDDSSVVKVYDRRL